MRLCGGLGNQMFQYAAARAVAHRNRAPLKLDISAFEGDQLRGYALHHFNIVESFATPREVERLTKRGLWGRCSRRLKCCLPRYRRSVFAERKNRFGVFDPDILRVRGGVYMVGYWQSEKYYEDIQDTIRREFTVRYAQDRQSQETADKIASTQSVGIHVRRADYVSNPGIGRVYANCDLNYYKECVALIA